jgi:TrmH family RNA methyltransferase
LSSKASDDAKKIAEMFHKKNIPVYIARKQQFEQLCDTKTPQSILAVVHNLDYQLSLNSPIIILESISDPGNFGTIIRTADWFGINHIITGSNSVDKYNPKVIRSTMGSIFRCNIQYIEDLLPFLHKASGDYEIYGASLKAKMTIEECKPKKKFILIFGNEAKGISQDIQSQLHFAYKIIGKGKAESLNLAVSVGISLYHFANCIK